MMVTYLTKKILGDNRAQSLVEFATFGSILLLCLGALIQYGMSANYEQNLQMQTFRKAQKAAYFKSGPASSISISRLEDKPIPDPRDPWGVPERRPIGAGGSATWDSNLQANYIDNYSSASLPSDLPRTIIEINDFKVRENALNDQGINTINRFEGAFTTAGFEERECMGRITVIFENSDTQRIESDRIWCNDFRVKNRRSKDDERGKEFAYYRLSNNIDGLDQILLSADVDNDGELENIIGVQGDLGACDNDGYCGRLRRFKYVDYQTGEIDTGLMQVYPWEINKQGANINIQQGLLYDTIVNKTINNTLTKTESPDTLRTDTAIGGQQEITHFIRTNSGAELEAHRTTFRPANLESYHTEAAK